MSLAGSLLGVSVVSPKSLMSWEDSIKSCVEKKGSVGSIVCCSWSCGDAAIVGCLGREGLNLGGTGGAIRCIGCPP